MQKAICLILSFLLMLTLFASCKHEKEAEEAPPADASDESVSIDSEAKIIETPLSKINKYYIGVKKSNTNLLQQVNSFIDHMKNDGSLDQIISSYYCENNITIVKSAEEATGKNQLIAATDARNPIFEEKNGDGFTGIDITLVKAFADSLGKELVIKDVNPDSFGDMLEAGDADLVISCLTDNAELKEQMSFSEPYFEATQVLIVSADDNRFDACTNTEELEAVLKEYTTKNKIGVRKYSTAQYYVIGDEEKGYEGLQAECIPYPNCKYAVENLLAGDVDCVITDQSAALGVLHSFQ